MLFLSVHYHITELCQFFDSSDHENVRKLKHSWFCNLCSLQENLSELGMAKRLWNCSLWKIRPLRGLKINEQIRGQKNRSRWTRQLRTGMPTLMAAMDGIAAWQRRQFGLRAKNITLYRLTSSIKTVDDCSIIINTRRHRLITFVALNAFGVPTT